MKKVMYYTCLIVFFLVFTLFMCAPFAGPMVIFYIIEAGFYEKKYVVEILNVKEFTPLLKIVNQVVALFFWISLMVPLVVFFVKQLSFNRKFQITMYCMLVLMAIFFLPKIILFLRR